jgi:hypothetical protein
MRRYKEMRAAEREMKRQKKQAAIQALIKKRQEHLLMEENQEIR